MYNRFKRNKKNGQDTQSGTDTNDNKSNHKSDLSSQTTTNPRSISLLPTVLHSSITAAHSTNEYSGKAEEVSKNIDLKEKEKEKEKEKQKIKIKVELPNVNSVNRVTPIASAPIGSLEGAGRSPRAQRQAILSAQFSVKPPDLIKPLSKINRSEKNEDTTATESISNGSRGSSASYSTTSDSTTSDSSTRTRYDVHLKPESVELKVPRAVTPPQKPIPPPKMNRHKTGVELANERVQTWLKQLFLLISLHSPEEVKAFIQGNQTGFSSSYLLNQSTKHNFTSFMYAVSNKRFSTALMLIQFGADPFKEPLGIKPLKELVGEDVWFYYTIEAMRSWKPLLTASEKKMLKFKEGSHTSSELEDTPRHSDFVSRLYLKIKNGNPL